jgi:hypothetical protein
MPIVRVIDRIAFSAASERKKHKSRQSVGRRDASWENYAVLGVEALQVSDATAHEHVRFLAHQRRQQLRAARKTENGKKGSRVSKVSETRLTIENLFFRRQYSVLILFQRRTTSSSSSN